MADLSAIGGGTGEIRSGFNLPTKILENNLMSDTSQAHECFINQKFSANLQAFLIDYVTSVSGPYSVYA